MPHFREEVKDVEDEELVGGWIFSGHFIERNKKLEELFKVFNPENSFLVDFKNCQANSVKHIKTLHNEKVESPQQQGPR